MKLFYILLISILIQSCSFDNKTGIWKNENTITKKKNKTFKDFKSINLLNQSSEETIPIEKNYKFQLRPASNNFNWNDIYYDQSNNLKNFKYDENYELFFKSKKISRNELNNFTLFEDNHIIATDSKGNLIIFSINEDKIISKYNFYKKKYKKIKKELNIIVENNIIYISDNLGYLYSYNYKTNKILWAKKYEVAFSSNLKIFKNKIITTNQNNYLFYFDKYSGEILTTIPTEETLIKNNFKNNLSLNENLTFFINTFGSLYAINNDTTNLVWFLNLNKSIDINPSNLFNGNQIIVDKNNLVISSNQNTHIINQKTGQMLYKKNFALNSSIRPIILNDHLFTITKKNFLTAVNLKNGKTIYSYNLNSRIAEYLKIKKRDADFKDLIILNDKIMIILQNSFVILFKINGEIEYIRKLPTNIKTSPMIIDKSLIFIDKKNKISILN
jgi:outer membrane protein assembly factor BamB